MKFQSNISQDNCFIREEAENTFTIFLIKTGLQFHVNRVGKYIYDLLEKYNDTNIVLNELFSSFPSIDKRIIESDFEDVFDLMLLYNVVNIEDDIKNAEYTETPLVRFAGDGDFRKIAKFFQATDKINKFSYLNIPNIEKINPVTLRYLSFHNLNYFCLTMDDSKEILAILPVRPPAKDSSVAIVDGFVFTKSLNEKEIIELCGKSFNLMKRTFETLTKIRFNYLSNFTNTKVLNILNKMDFIEETELKNEFGSLSLHMISKKMD